MIMEMEKKIHVTEKLYNDLMEQAMNPFRHSRGSEEKKIKI